MTTRHHLTKRPFFIGLIIGFLIFNSSATLATESCNNALIQRIGPHLSRMISDIERSNDTTNNPLVDVDLIAQIRLTLPDAVLYQRDLALFPPKFDDNFKYIHRDTRPQTQTRTNTPPTSLRLLMQIKVQQLQQALFDGSEEDVLSAYNSFFEFLGQHFTEDYFEKNLNAYLDDYVSDARFNGFLGGGRAGGAAFFLDTMKNYQIRQAHEIAPFLPLPLILELIDPRLKGLTDTPWPSAEQSFSIFPGLQRQRGILDHIRDRISSWPSVHHEAFLTARGVRYPLRSPRDLRRETMPKIGSGFMMAPIEYIQGTNFLVALRTGVQIRDIKSLLAHDDDIIAIETADHLHLTDSSIHDRINQAVQPSIWVHETTRDSNDHLNLVYGFLNGDKQPFYRVVVRPRKTPSENKNSEVLALMESLRRHGIHPCQVIRNPNVADPDQITLIVSAHPSNLADFKRRWGDLLLSFEPAFASRTPQEVFQELNDLTINRSTIDLSLIKFMALFFADAFNGYL